MAQLGNYDSGTAETPETDESVSVSVFPDEMLVFCLSTSGNLECVNFFTKHILCLCVQGNKHIMLVHFFRETN